MRRNPALPRRTSQWQTTFSRHFCPAVATMEVKGAPLQPPERSPIWQIVTTWIETATGIANASAAAAGTGIVDVIGAASTPAILGSTATPANRAAKNGIATGSAAREMRDVTARVATKTTIVNVAGAAMKAGATPGTPARSE